MAITYDQFLKVIPNDFARTTMGLEMSPDQISFLLSDEAHLIAFYDEWTRRGQPRSFSNDEHANPNRPPPAPRAAPTPAPAKLPFAAVSTTTIVFASLSLLFVGQIFVGVIFGFAGVLIGLFGLGLEDWKQRRGRGATIVALLSGAVVGTISIFVT